MDVQCSYRKVVVACLCMLLTIGNVFSQETDTVCIGTEGRIYSVDNHMGSTYFWLVTGGSILSGNGTSRIQVNWGKKPGLFRVAAVEQNKLGCFGDTVFAPVFIKGKNLKVDYPLLACKWDSVTLRASGGINYLWSNGRTDSLNKIRIISDTSYFVIISDSTCGFRKDTLNMSIKVVQPPNANFSSDVTDFYKNQYTYLSYAGNSKDKVIWQIEKSNISRMTSHDINIKFIDTGEAHIKLISVNSMGCIDSSIKVIDIKDEQLYIPDAFTPNGDGLNDTFKPGGIGIKSYHMQVFNGWGQQLFETNNMQDGWNGSYEGTPVQDGVYTYFGEATGHSGKIFNFSGSVTILR